MAQKIPRDPFALRTFAGYSADTVEPGIPKVESTIIIMPLVMSPLIIGQNYQRHKMK